MKSTPDLTGYRPDDLTSQFPRWLCWFGAHDWMVIDIAAFNGLVTGELPHVWAELQWCRNCGAVASGLRVAGLAGLPRHLQDRALAQIGLTNTTSPEKS